VSNAIGGSPSRSTVTLAMPPMFSAARAPPGAGRPPSSSTSNTLASGAP
jgi:hypothetical protein